MTDLTLETLDKVEKLIPCLVVNLYIPEVLLAGEDSKHNLMLA